MPEGGVVRLLAGTYRLARRLEIRKSVKILGEGSDATTVEGEGDEFFIRFAGPGELRLQGIAFANTGSTSTSVVVVAAGTALIQGCRFTGACGSGLHFSCNASGTATLNICEQNDGFGISVADQAAPSLRENACRKNAVGVVYAGSAGGTARENTCEQNDTRGIVVFDQAAPTLRENACRKNGDDDIHIADTAKPVIRG